MAGSQEWTLTRLINGYVVRKYGFDAMARVSRGELSLTDPGFLEAADVVQRMALQAYFGEHVNTTDLDEAIATFLQGRAAINCSYRARTTRRTCTWRICRWRWTSNHGARDKQEGGRIPVTFCYEARTAGYFYILLKLFIRSGRHA